MTGDGGILVRRMGEEGWTSPDTAVYRDERHLQALLAQDPDRIPGVKADALTVQELGTSGGPIDVCIVGRDGAVTVVECKLASSSERRRMVVGQVIDYAASIWLDGPDAFIDAWNARTGDDLREELESDAIERLRRNITEGRIDLCLAVDAIDADLRRLVEFLNQATRTDVTVTALQLAYARHGEIEILIPSTFGGEIAEAKNRASSRGIEHWTKQSFLEALHPDDRPLAERLFELNDAMTEPLGTSEPYWFGARPGGHIFFSPYRQRYQPFSILQNSAGRLMVWGAWTNFTRLAHHEAYAELAAFLGQSHVDGSRRVSASSLDLDALWKVACECAKAINSIDGEEADGIG